MADDRLLTRTEFQKLASIGERKMRELLRDGRVREVRLGARTSRIPASELTRLAQSDGEARAS